MPVTGPPPPEGDDGSGRPGDELDLDQLAVRLRRAFVARFGVEVGVEVTAEVMAWAWEHRDELALTANPAGYLYRVGQSRSRRLLRWRRERVVFPVEQRAGAGDEPTPWTEPHLGQALALLWPDERIAVVLVHCYQWTYPEVAALLDVPLHTVRNRVHRGLSRLRSELGVSR